MAAAGHSAAVQLLTPAQGDPGERGARGQDVCAGTTCCVSGGAICPRPETWEGPTSVAKTCFSKHCLNLD